MSAEDPQHDAIADNRDDQAAVPAIVDALRGGLVVSCQARPGSPLRSTAAIVALAAAAEQGGAAGLRVASPDDVRAVRARTALPIVGLHKVDAGGRRPLITPTVADAVALVEAGADIVAIECVAETRHPSDLAEMLASIHAHTGVPVMADVSTLNEGLTAWALGAALVATTLSGYTASSTPRGGPDLDLAAALVKSGVRTVLEGRVQHPRQVAEAFDLGAWCVVVGAAITDPVHLTRAYAEHSPGRA